MATNTSDVLSMMDEETRRASERRAGNFVPTFLRLNDGQKARIRPLFNLSQCLVLDMHNKYSQADPKQSINAVCGKEVSDSCLYCEAMVNDRKLTAGKVFFLPVYVSTLEQKNDGGQWVPVTYEKDGQAQEVSGLRLLELKAYGTMSIVMQTLRGLYSDDEKHDIRQYGLIVERIGFGQSTKHTILPKGPGAMPEAAKALIPTLDKVKEMVLSAMPPAGVTVTSFPRSSQGAGATAPAAAAASGKLLGVKMDDDF